MIIYYNQAKIKTVKVIGYKNATYPHDFKSFGSTPNMQEEIDIIEPDVFYQTPISEFENTAFFIGVLKNLSEKQALRDYIKLHNLNKCSFIHNSTSVSSDVIISPGVWVGQFCVLSYNSMLSEDCLILPYSLISHGTKIGIGANICPGSIINGTTNIGDYCYIGSSTTIKDGISIVANTFIGMSSTVSKSIELAGTYIGSPARRVSDLTVFDHFNFGAVG